MDAPYTPCQRVVQKALTISDAVPISPVPNLIGGWQLASVVPLQATRPRNIYPAQGAVVSVTTKFLTLAKPGNENLPTRKTKQFANTVNTTAPLKSEKQKPSGLKLSFVRTHKYIVHLPLRIPANPKQWPVEKRWTKYLLHVAISFLVPTCSYAYKDCVAIALRSCWKLQLCLGDCRW